MLWWCFLWFDGVVGWIFFEISRCLVGKWWLFCFLLKSLWLWLWLLCLWLWLMLLWLGFVWFLLVFWFSFLCELCGVIWVWNFWNLLNRLFVLLRCRVCKRFFYLLWWWLWGFFFVGLIWFELLKDWWVFCFVLNGLGVWMNEVNGLFFVWLWLWLFFCELLGLVLLGSL